MVQGDGGMYSGEVIDVIQNVSIIKCFGDCGSIKQVTSGGYIFHL